MLRAASRAPVVIIRSAVERPDGYGFATAGDSSCAAFSSAVDAVTAALAPHRELRGADVIPFAVWMALHSVEANARDHAYYGREVTGAARLPGACGRLKRSRVMRRTATSERSASRHSR